MRVIVASDNNTTPQRNVKARFWVALTSKRDYVEGRFSEMEALNLENHGKVNELGLGEFAYGNAFALFTNPDDILVERAGTDVEHLAVALYLLERRFVDYVAGKNEDGNLLAKSLKIEENVVA
jgi:hypothetical protein